MKRQSTQHDYMRMLVNRYGMDGERVVREYADAEERGDVERKSNTRGYTAKQYARALWLDGMRKGWLNNVQ
jgi:hypothetical protein